MEKYQKSVFIYIVAFLSVLIPVPGRFVYGFTIMMELTLLALSGTFIDFFVKKLGLHQMRTSIVLFMLIAITILYRQIFSIVQSEVALILGFVFYIPSISLFLIGLILKEDEKTLPEKLKSNMTNILIFDIFGLLFFLFRDIAGYGTFTFFGKNHQIFEKVLFDESKPGIFGFFATIPGALILSGIILFVYLVILQKFKIIKNSKQQDSVEEN